MIEHTRREKDRALGECTAEIVRLQSPPADLADYLNRFPDKKMLRRWLNLKPDLSPNFEWTWDWNFDAGKEEQPTQETKTA